MPFSVEEVEENLKRFTSIENVDTSGAEEVSK
jgi:hypothetical protein